MKCLVTKLKEVVNNDFIPKLGYFPVELENINDTVINLNVASSKKPLLYLPTGGGYVTDITGVENKGKEISTSMVTINNKYYLSKDSNLIFVEKYSLTKLEIENSKFAHSINVEDIMFCNSLEFINIHLTGDFAKLPDAFFSNLYQVRLTDAINLKNFNISRFKNATKCITISVFNANYKGDVGDIPASMITMYFYNSSGLLTYTKTRDSKAKILALYGGVNLGNNIDKYLIESAKLISNSNISDYQHTTISLKGQRTNSSDEALQRLQEFGLTVSIKSI